MSLSRYLKYSFFVVFFLWTFGVNAQLVELSFDNGFCSGFIAKLTNKSQKAYLFTAGHCIPGLGDKTNSNKIITNIKMEKLQKFIARAVSSGKHGFVNATELVLATFQRVDLAIYSLKESVTELENAGLPPFLIHTGEAHIGTPIKVFNPLIGEDASCFIDAHPFRLAFQEWLWFATVRLSSQCKLGPGWSGAPVVDVSSGMILGILSGGNDSGDCADYCEIDKAGDRIAFKNRSYYSTLSFLNRCLNQNGQIAVEPTCLP